MPEVKPQIKTREELINDYADLKARMRMFDIAEHEYHAGNHSGSATLMHACYYLENREEYQANPAPKNCIKIQVTAEEFAEMEADAIIEALPKAPRKCT